MPWKKPSDLSDKDVRGAIAHLLLQNQELEVILTEVIMLALAQRDAIETPTEEELESTYEDLRQFLRRAHDKLKQINDTTDRLQAEHFARN